MHGQQAFKWCVYCRSSCWRRNGHGWTSFRFLRSTPRCLTGKDWRSVTSSSPKKENGIALPSSILFWSISTSGRSKLQVCAFVCMIQSKSWQSPSSIWYLTSYLHCAVICTFVCVYGGLCWRLFCLHDERSGCVFHTFGRFCLCTFKRDDVCLMLRNWSVTSWCVLKVFHVKRMKRENLQTSIFSMIQRRHIPHLTSSIPTKRSPSCIILWNSTRLTI